MKKTLKKVISVAITVVILVSFMTSVFALGNSSEISGLQNYLKNSENTGFDFTETSFSDNDIDWAVFSLSRSGVKAYPEYSEYINSVVKNSFDKLYPSDLARITLAVSAYGLDAENIGGHNLVEALKAVDYKTQTYLSSLIYPLIALNFSDSFKISTLKEKEIIDTMLSSQQIDGGFPYSTVDSGFGISSDLDTTSMAVQALSKYYKTDSVVKVAIDKALAYIKSQQFDDGSFGYVTYNSKSGESTAQVIIALTMLGINPQSEDYTKTNGNPVSALKQFIDADTGAGLDYSASPSTLTSYQILMGYNADVRFNNNANDIYTLENIPETTTTITTEGTKENITQATTVSHVDIPKTGNSSEMIFTAAILLVTTMVVISSKKKES